MILITLLLLCSVLAGGSVVCALLCRSLEKCCAALREQDATEQAQLDAAMRDDVMRRIHEIGVTVLPLDPPRYVPPFDGKIH